MTAMTADHADAVLAIYRAGLDTGAAGFETAAHSPDELAALVVKWLRW